MRESLIRFIRVTIFTLLLAATFCRSGAAEIRLGILPRSNAVELFTQFEPLAVYLTEAVGEKVSLVIPRDFEAFKDAARAGTMDLGFANPLTYVQLKKELALTPLAVAADRKSGTKFRGVMIARADSGIRTLQDLRGKKLIFVDRDSAAGYLFQVVLLKKEGIDIRKDVTVMPFAKRHENVALAVINRTADAGGMRESDYERMKVKVDLSKITVIGYTDFAINWPFFALPHFAEDKVLKIKNALLKLKPGRPLPQKPTAAAGLAGFEPAADRDFEKIREAARLAGLL